MKELVKLLGMPRDEVSCLGLKRHFNCSGSTRLNCRAVFTACISIHNTALWTQRVMPIEKQSFSQQSIAIVTLIESKGTCMRMCTSLYHETRVN